MKNFIYEGYLKLGSNGEEEDILFLQDRDEPVAEELEYKLSNKFCTVRYYICNTKVTLEEAQEYFIRQLYGEIDVLYGMSYSEITGYLWTDEKLNVGGHDLLNELKSYVGKYLILIVDIDEVKEKEKEIKSLWNRARQTLNNFDGISKSLGLSRVELIDELEKIK